MKTIPTLIRQQPLPKLSSVFSANRRPVSREAGAVGQPWKKINVRPRD